VEAVGSTSARDVTAMGKFETLKMMTEKLGGKTTQEAAECIANQILSAFGDGNPAAAQAAARMRPQGLTRPQVAPGVKAALEDAADESAASVADSTASLATEEAATAALEESPAFLAAEGTDVATSWIPGVGAMISGSAMTGAMLYQTYDTSNQILASYVKNINTFYAAMDTAVDNQAEYLYDQYLQHQ